MHYYAANIKRGLKKLLMRSRFRPVRTMQLARLSMCFCEILRTEGITPHNKYSITTTHSHLVPLNFDGSFEIVVDKRFVFSVKVQNETYDLSYKGSESCAQPTLLPVFWRYDPGEQTYIGDCWDVDPFDDRNWIGKGIWGEVC